jgi:hypothetical protein
VAGCTKPLQAAWKCVGSWTSASMHDLPLYSFKEEGDGGAVCPIKEAWHPFTTPSPLHPRQRELQCRLSDGYGHQGRLGWQILIQFGHLISIGRMQQDSFESRYLFMVSSPVTGWSIPNLTILACTINTPTRQTPFWNLEPCKSCHDVEGVKNWAPHNWLRPSPFRGINGGDGAYIRRMKNAMKLALGLHRG